jgi:UDP-glucose 4-epimerase
MNFLRSLREMVMADPGHVLVTGGAGFIGSHTVERLDDRVDRLVVADDLFAGKREYVPEDATFYEQDVRSKEFRSTVREESPDGLRNDDYMRESYLDG